MSYGNERAFSVGEEALDCTCACCRQIIVAGTPHFWFFTGEENFLVEICIQCILDMSQEKTSHN